MYGRRTSMQYAADAKIICYRNLFRRRTMMLCVTTSPYVKVRHPVLNLLKAGNWALESGGFMTQRAPFRLLPTGHHSNDLVPLPPRHHSRRRRCITQPRLTTAS